PASRVSGIVLGADGPVANLNIQLFPAGIDEMVAESAATAVTDAAGRFTFLGVPQGNYTLKAQKNARPGAGGPLVTSIVRGADGQTSMMTYVTGSTQTLLNGVPTDFTIGAGADTMWAQVPVSVGDQDVTGLGVTLRQGLRASGRIVFEGSAAPPTADV